MNKYILTHSPTLRIKIRLSTAFTDAEMAWRTITYSMAGGPLPAESSATRLTPSKNVVDKPRLKKRIKDNGNIPLISFEDHLTRSYLTIISVRKD